MITFFTIPKPFRGHIDVIQRNAIASWKRLDPGAQVILLGDEDGVAAAARELGVEHVADIECSELGTPRLDSAFAVARERATGTILCFANTDVVLLDDFRAAVDQLATLDRAFLLIGESWDTPVDHVLESPDDWNAVRGLPGKKRGAGAIDWFVFTPGLYDELPPFLVGRPKFDNWLVWRACEQDALVVDGTRVVHAVHQHHDYSHVTGGFDETRLGDEARRNAALVGSKDRLYTRFDATHVLTPSGLRPNLGSRFRAKERARKLIYKLRHGQLRRSQIA